MNAGLFSITPKEIILRDYQEKATTLAMQSMGRSNHIVLQLSTGSGKTIIAANLVKRAVKAGKKVAFVCDRLALIDQTSKVFAEYGITHGVIQADHPMTDPRQMVQICSIATLKNKPVHFDFVIIDECHALAKAHHRLIASTEYVIGLTATPWAKGMGLHFKDLVAPLKMRYLIANGYLVDFVVYAPNTIDTKGLRTVAGDFNKKQMAERADKAKITGDIVKHWLKLANGLKTICFCVNIAHAKHVAREFNRNGVKAVEVNSWQKTTDGERQKVMAEFCEGDAIVICSVDILGKGFDYPKVDCVIQARPTKSRMVHVQQVGRGLRTYKDAPPCLILDHAGNHSLLGFVDDQPDLPLDNGERKTSKRKDKESEEPLPKPCPSCDFLKPAKVHKCPACGEEPEHIEDVDVEDGSLSELKRKKKDRKEYNLQDKQRFLGCLNTYAKSKGMKKHAKGFYGWALYRYKDKFGCSPSNTMDWASQTGVVDQDVENFIIHGNIKYAKSNTVMPVSAKSKKCECGSDEYISKDKPNDTHRVGWYCRKCGKWLKWGANI